MPAVELHLADADALAIQRVSAARAWSPGLRMAWYQRAWPGTQACVARYSSNLIHIKYIHSTDNSGPLALHQAGIYILYICVLIVLLYIRPNGKWKTRRRPQRLCWWRAPTPPNFHYHTAPARPCPPKEP